MSRPLRILQVLDKLSMDGRNPSSPAMVVADWIRHADRSRIEMSAHSLRPPEPAGLFLEDLGVPVDYLYLGPYDMRNVPALARLIRKEQADVVHVHGFSGANFGRLAAALTGVISVVQEHAVCRVPPYQAAADAALRGLTDHAIAVAGNVKEFMARRRHVPEERIEVLYNGVNVARFAVPPGVRERKRRELGIPADAPVIGAVTRLRAEKGVSDFLAAAQRLRPRFPAATFLVIGSGPLRSALAAEAGNLGLGDAVRFLGFRHDIPELLSALDVHLIPSHTEGCPLSLLEAMAAGNTIVGTAVGGLREIAEATGAARLVPARDPDAMAGAVAALLDDPAEARRLASAALAAADDFSAVNAARRLTDFYERIAGHRLRRQEPAEAVAAR